MVLREQVAALEKRVAALEGKGESPKTKGSLGWAAKCAIAKKAAATVYREEITGKTSRYYAKSGRKLFTINGRINIHRYRDGAVKPYTYECVEFKPFMSWVNTLLKKRAKA